MATVEIEEMAPCPTTDIMLLGIGATTFNVRLARDQLPAVVGRDAKAAVRLDDTCISRRHCEIHEVQGTLVVRDTASKNGTWVNGDCIDQSHLLPGDRLAVGGMTFMVEYERPAGAPAGGLRVGRRSLQSVLLAPCRAEPCCRAGA